MSLPVAPAPIACLSEPIAVVLLDDNPQAREGIAVLLRARPAFQVLAASVDVAEAVRIIRDARPALVLLNLQRERDDGLTLAGVLHGEVPESRLIIMGLEPAQAHVADLVGAGVSGFLMADVSFDTFRSTIRSVAQGVQILPRQLISSLFAQLKRSGVLRRPKQPLDAKQLAVTRGLQVAATAI